MLTPKHLLLQLTTAAFTGRPDMPLAASLDGVTQPEAAWQPDPATPSIEHLVRHVAWAKSHYCHEAFGRPLPLTDPTVNADGDSPDLSPNFPCGAGWGRDQSPGIAGAIDLLHRAHRTLTECLAACPEDALERPLPTRHGQSAAHFFQVMLMHDLYHAGQIRTRRTLYRSSTV